MIEIVVVVGALLRAMGVVSIDLAGIVAAVAAAGVAWLSLKQHESIARAYSYAAAELAIAASRLRALPDETDWATEVDNAEEAISREHRMWREFDRRSDRRVSSVPAVPTMGTGCAPLEGDYLRQDAGAWDSGGGRRGGGGGSRCSGRLMR